MPTLLYHAHQGTGPRSMKRCSRWPVAVVRIVSPYIGVAYLERIIGVSQEWRLVSDVQVWLAFLSTQARPRAWAVAVGTPVERGTQALLGPAAPITASKGWPLTCGWRLGPRRRLPTPPRPSLIWGA